MPKHTPALATRAAVVATSTVAAAILSTLAAGPATAAPAPAAPAAPVAPAVLPLSFGSAAHAASQAAAARSSAAGAVERALGKIGAPYRWGATGPNAFDCSGLVKWAFSTTGAELPRTSRAMSRVGTPVSRDALRPGDLVFFYRPVSHVGIYIGDGKIVHASNRRDPVKISDIDRMPFNSARRVV